MTALKMGEKLGMCQIVYLQPLCQLAHFMGFSPLYKFEGQKYDVKDWYKYYGFFMMCFIVCGAALSIFGRTYAVYPYLPTTLIIVDAASAILLTIANISMIYSTAVLNWGDFVKYFARFREIDVSLSNETSGRERLLQYYAENIIGHIFVVSFYVYDAYFWVDTLRMSAYKNYMVRTYQSYLNFVTMIFIRNCVYALRCRFKILNGLIAKFGTSLHFSARKDRSGIWTVNEFQRIYIVLSEQVSLCNKVFGYPMLFLSLYFVCELIHSLIMCILYCVSKNRDIHGVVFGSNLFILCFFWLIKDLVLFLFVISPCDDATGEAKQTSIICYKLLQELPYVNSIFQDKSMRDDLILLAIQSSTRYPTFSAAGFFTVDYTMLFTLLGSITSYLVVLIQFN